MSMERKVPNIRFKGFSGEWENKKIGRILTEIKRPIELMDNTSYQLVTVKRRNEGVVPRAILKGKNILVKNYFRVEAGDYLISKRQVVHGANGIVPDNLDGAVVSNEYLVVTDSDDITAKYWTIISIRPEMHKIFFVSSYGVDIEKLVFDVTDWKNRTIFIPQVTEQKNITNYFQKLDALINQHQQKHDKLSNIKKAMLEKMFPKPGETVPEIRFKGFSGEWEERGFSDIATRISTHHQSTLLPCVEYEDIVAGKGRLNKDIHQKKTFKAGLKFESDDVLFGKLRPYLKNWFLADFEGLAVGDFWVLRANNVASTFLFSLIQTNGFELISNLSAGSKMPRSDWGLVSSSCFFVPKNISESNEIGSYFQKLDALINQHQQQITKLNNIKQACLSKMFV
ncbi:restriction endonuclease subunit S [Klebsiella quasipneumoniae]|jgi:type I restriction enzyme S subunit|nr:MULTISPECIES: restriction endonuclease subunit S [Klebsiella]HEO9329680.1 restriction endonuclease subunit S [Klebsiella pneumoniae subsp. pneumoniae]MCM6073311.1 restriction endonuclease subunit S [Klebsiella pneumoniae]MCM6289424.1 restriction endonuclease subunit S [Klebsiella pneumoniae]MCP6617658.1 restriction endonuclease subunit S [Klebsiella pneumoniae]MCT8906016.1 restriction endonuclease subunit S [Klebsiella pneumoniae]